MSKYDLKALKRASLLGQIRGLRDVITDLTAQVESLEAQLPAEWCVRRVFAKGRKYDFASDLGMGSYGWAKLGTGKKLVGEMDTMIDLAKRLAEVDPDYVTQRLYEIQVFDREDGEILLTLPNGSSSR